MGAQLSRHQQHFACTSGIWNLPQVVVTARAMHATVFKDQQGRRFRDAESALAARSIFERTTVCALMAFGFSHLIGAGRLPECNFFLAVLMTGNLLQS